jgi:hypothetical protein
MFVVNVALIQPIGADFRRNVLISALLLWTLASWVWSNDPSASVTNGVRMTLDVAISFDLLKCYAFNDLLKLLLLVRTLRVVRQRKRLGALLLPSAPKTLDFLTQATVVGFCLCLLR